MNPEKKQGYDQALAAYTAALKQLNDAWPMDLEGEPSEEAWQAYKRHHLLAVSLTTARRKYYGRA